MVHKRLGFYFYNQLPIELADQATLDGDEVLGAQSILDTNEIITSREIETFDYKTIVGNF